MNRKEENEDQVSEPVKTLPADTDTNSLNRSTVDSLSVLSGINNRIAQADLNEMNQLLQVRALLVAQEEEAKQNEHRRIMEVREGYARAGLSSVALLSGTIITLSGFVIPGCFVLGAGLGVCQYSCRLKL